MNNHCLYCDAVIQEEMTWRKFLFGAPEQSLCKTCKGKLIIITDPVCRKCSRPFAKLEAEYIHEDICHDCFRWEKDSKWKGVLERNVSIYDYNDFLKEMLARYKYRGDYALAKAFSPEVRSIVSRASFDLAVPIPLSSERLMERGFNQAAALAAEAGFETFDALVRIHGEKQSKKSREERIHLKQVFKVNQDVSGKVILLIDDIYTTGSTLHHAAHALMEAGAKSVSSFTLARG
ncbi:ComF family protein [Siminovitchia fortis]|uniref:ComF family protein n=1 Tax=Siminovitchia fortis TaxID=254758 RepID=A0A443IZH2_9BACI|nr:ComF family protein [Siminovitchia fortis]RWR13591.1 ComF family protein [Siminovitchia fortis]WHY81952.1 ComF family protein [Siminovitchia fortis]